MYYSKYAPSLLCQVTWGPGLGEEIESDGWTVWIDGVNYVIFRGSNTLNDIQDSDQNASPTMGIHTGYLTAANNAIPSLLERIRPGPLVFAGFSRGGGIAAILAYMAKSAGFKAEGYSFGTPASFQSPPDNVRWWVSRQDPLVQLANNRRREHGYVYGDKVVFLDGARHIPSEYARAM